MTPKLAAAIEMLEQGLRTYYDGAYFAALHLADAADEILGRYVTRCGSESAYDSMKAGAVRIAEYLAKDPEYTLEGPPVTEKGIVRAMNYARNRTKHIDPKGDDEILFNPQRVARDVLQRALTNYYDLMSRLPLEESELMRRFNNEHL